MSESDHDVIGLREDTNSAHNNFNYNRQTPGTVETGTPLTTVTPDAGGSSAVTAHASYQVTPQSGLQMRYQGERLDQLEDENCATNAAGGSARGPSRSELLSGVNTRLARTKEILDTGTDGRLPPKPSLPFAKGDVTSNETV